MKIRHLLVSHELVEWTRFEETTCIFLIEGCSWWILAICISRMLEFCLNDVLKDQSIVFYRLFQMDINPNYLDVFSKLFNLGGGGSNHHPPKNHHFNVFCKFWFTGVKICIYRWLEFKRWGHLYLNSFLEQSGILSKIGKISILLFGKCVLKLRRSTTENLNLQTGLRSNICLKSRFSTKVDDCTSPE